MRPLVPAIVLALMPAGALGQMPTGTPPLGTYQAAGFGNLSLQNLNLSFTVPVVSKTGRGLSFNFPINYSSLIWYPLNGAWVGVADANGNPTWGWQTNYTSPAAPSWGYTQVAYSCQNGGQQYNGTKQFAFWYIDATGTTHQFPSVILYGGGLVADCGLTDTYTGYASDGSGYYMDQTVPAVYDGGGNNVTNPVAPEDTNGNYITPFVNGNATTYTDTLGETALTVTVVSSTETDYSYANPSREGGTSTVKLLSTSLNIKTNFGCSGIVEYTGTATLPTEIELPDGSNYKFSYEPTPANPGYYTARIASVTLPTGGVISYTYTGGSNGTECSDGSTAGLQVTTPDGTWTYTRSNSSGYWQTTAQDSQGNQTVLDFQGIYQTERLVYQGTAGGTLLEDLDTCYNGASAPCAGTSVTAPVTRRTVFTKWPSGQESETDVSCQANSILPTEEDDYGYGSGSPGPLLRKALTQYASLGKILDEPSSVTVENGSGTIVAQTTYSYDQGTPVSTSGTPQHATAFGSRGNPTTIGYLVQGSTYVTRTLSYFDTGNIYQATDPDGTASTLGYDTSTNSFLASATLAPSLSTSYQWAGAGGVPTSAADPNGNATTYSYKDPNFWRPTTVSYPGGGWKLYTYPSPTETDTYTGITSTTPSTTCTSCRHDELLLDSLGRQSQKILVSDPDGQTTITTTYDSDGRVASITTPERTGAPTNGTTTMSYDALNRPTQTTHPDGSSQHIYYGSSVSTNGGIGSQLCSSSTYGLGYPALTIDPAGKKREAWTDALGRTIEVDEPDGNNTLTKPTCYAYDANGHLTQVVSPGGQTRAYVYDDLGHLTSETTPESGATTFTYDNAGYMLTRTDARNFTTTYRYKENDAMHRLASITYSDTTPSVTYSYDETYNYNFNVNISNGLGRRTSMTDGSGQTAWSYDVMGRVIEEWRTIAGVTKTIKHSFNLDGSTASIAYPDNTVVQYTYNNAQRPLSAVDSFGNNYAQNATYAPQGALAGVLLGQALPGFRGIAETWAYNNDLETTSIAASSSNGSVFSLGYSYALPGGNNGSVAGITNNLDSGRNESMTYDPLNRILTAQTAASSGQDCWGLGFGTGNGAADDPLGNLLSMSVTKCSGPSLSVSVNGNNQLNSTGFSYDAAGNMTSDGQRSYAYNAENELTSNGGTTYSYDGDGLRAQRASNFLYWRDSSGSMIEQTDAYGDMEVDYIFFAGRRIAWRNNSGNAYYMFADALGSIRAATDASGNTCFSADYYPYGQENDYVTTCAPAYRFAGYELDEGGGSSLYYAHARYYSPSLGRFMSPDPLGGHLGNPQSLDRYAYVVNNPETFADPTGEIVCRKAGAGCPLTNGGGGDDGPDLNCTWDGVTCGESGGDIVDTGAAVECPNDVCSGWATDPSTGQLVWVQYICGAGGTCAYLMPSETPGIYEAGGTFMNQGQYTSWGVMSNSAAAGQQLEGTVKAIATALNIPLDTAFQILASSGSSGMFLKGGNLNFLISQDAYDDLLSAGGCTGTADSCRLTGGLHAYEETEGGTDYYYVHLDSADPFLAPWDFFEHAFVDVFLGNWFYLIIPRPSP